MRTCGALQKHGAHWWTVGNHTVSCPGNLKDIEIPAPRTIEELQRQYPTW